MWENDTYFYSIKTLKAIAENYPEIYEGFAISWKSDITNLWVIAEFKADFDMALDSIGIGKWTGNINGSIFKDYRKYGILQRIIIAYIMDVKDDTLTQMGFYNIPQLRHKALYLMRKKLNGEEEKCKE